MNGKVNLDGERYEVNLTEREFQKRGPCSQIRKPSKQKIIGKFLKLVKGNNKEQNAG